MPKSAKVSSPAKKTATKRARKSAVKKSTAKSSTTKSSANSAATTSLRDEVVAYRRERILQAACDAFFEHGYHECTVDMIAERLSGSKAIVYYYFSDKHSILFEIYSRALEDAQALVRKAATENTGSTERLAAIARAYAQWVLEHARTVGVYWREVQSLSEEARSAVFAEQKKLDEIVAGVIREGVKDGSFKVSDEHMTARAITGMITFTYTWWRDDKRLTREQAADAYADMALRLAGSLG